MNGIEAHFTGRLDKDAELRRTKAGKAMTMLSGVVSSPDSDAGIKNAAQAGTVGWSAVE